MAVESGLVAAITIGVVTTAIGVANLVFLLIFYRSFRNFKSKLENSQGRELNVGLPVQNDNIHIIEDERPRPLDVGPVHQQNNQLVTVEEIKKVQTVLNDRTNGDIRHPQHACKMNSASEPVINDESKKGAVVNSNERKRVNFNDRVCYSTLVTSSTDKAQLEQQISIESSDNNESCDEFLRSSTDDEMAATPNIRTRLSGPQFTISMKKKNAVDEPETANVYGNIEPDSQVVAIAQNFYKETTCSSDIVGIDDIDIIDKRKQFTRQDAVSRPTSMLHNIQESIEDNTVHQQAAFVHRKINRSGGTIENLGVRLVIPEGAVEQEIQITLGITWDSSMYPKLSKNLTMLSPVVVCQPSTTFLKPVQLSFPHSAVCHHDNWKLSVYCRDNDLHQANVEWRELTADDYSDMLISEHQVVLQLKHFTLYTLVGQGIQGKTAAKAVKILAFASPFQVNKMYTVRIYCINNYENDSSEMKSIFSHARTLNEKQADVPQPLFIHDNGEDLIVNLTKLTNGWENDGSRIQKINFDSIWQSLSPSCKFLFHPSGNSDKKIVCQFSYFQQGTETQHVLKVADEYRVVLPLALERNPSKKQRKVIQGLLLKLDPESNGDYRLLAEKLGYTAEQITWLRQVQTPKSPTETILEQWIQDGNRLRDLHPCLVSMGRLDAASVIEDAVTEQDEETDF